MENPHHQTKSHLKAPDFFLLLGILISLISTFVSAVNLVFKGFDRIMPDSITGYFSIGSGVQNALAYFIVSFIVLYILEYINKKRTIKDKNYLLIPLRKWMLLSVLFILGLVILADLITLIKYFLSGEVTTRFISKVLALFLFSSVVFIYYFHVLTWDNIWSKHSRKAFSYVGLLIAVLVVLFGFYLIGSPKTQRMIRIDQERENAVRSINSQVINFWQTTGQMPQAISDLEKLPNYNTNYRQDLSAYTYKLIDGKKRDYEICTNFNLSTYVINSYMDQTNFSYGGSSIKMSDVALPGGYTAENWDHPVGDYCFKKNIDPKFYPVYEER